VFRSSRCRHWRLRADPTGALAAIYLFFLIAGALGSFRSLPFAFALGVGRRSYYAGTALLAVGLAAVYGLVLAVLQVIEQATGGWGVRLHFFRVAHILPGSWYLTWLISFVLLVLMFVYGMWFGLVYRRWNLFGLLVFMAAVAIVVVVGVVIASQVHAWPAIGRFLASLSAAGITGLLAALAVLLLAEATRPCAASPSDPNQPNPGCGRRTGRTTTGTTVCFSLVTHSRFVCAGHGPLRTPR